jgi:N-glycosylase/DNA lyase
VNCARAVEELKKKALILKGGPRRISPRLKGLVRFHNKKAEYLVHARRLFDRKKNGAKIGSLLTSGHNRAAREWLVRNVKGIGYKEASHFLRNVGLGEGLAILDRHILKNLKRYGALRKIPPSISSGRTYLALEEKAAGFARKVAVPLKELDLLLWSLETGFVFK